MHRISIGVNSHIIRRKGDRSLSPLVGVYGDREGFSRISIMAIRFSPTTSIRMRTNVVCGPQTLRLRGGHWCTILDIHAQVGEKEVVEETSWNAWLVRWGWWGLDTLACTSTWSWEPFEHW